MENKIILNFIRNEILEAFQSKEVVKRNLIIISIECILALLLSKNNNFSETTISFFRFQMFLTSTTVVCVLLINTTLIKYNAKKNNVSNYNYVLKYSQYIKFSVFSAMFFQLIFILVKIFKLKNKFLIILGFLVFLNTFLNLIFSVNVMVNSFNEPQKLDRFNLNKVDLTKKDSH